MNTHSADHVQQAFNTVQPMTREEAITFYTNKPKPTEDIKAAYWYIIRALEHHDLNGAIKVIQSNVETTLHPVRRAIYKQVVRELSQDQKEEEY